MDSTTTDYNYYGEFGEESYHRMNRVNSLMVVRAVTSLLGISGNGLVIWFGIFRMKKTVSLVWFLSLAVADFIFALFLPWQITYNALDHWPFGGFMCKLYVFILYFNTSISALQLAVLSIDRCVRVAFPQWCQNHRTRRLALIVVLIIWFLSSASCVTFSIFSYTIEYYSQIVCQFSLSLDNMKIIFIIRSVFLSVIPFIIIVCNYIGITLYSLNKHLPLCSRSFTVTLAVSMTFLVYSSHFYVFQILKISHATPYYYEEKVKEIIEMIRVIGSCINPVFYVLIGWEIKGNFCSSFQAMFEKAFAEDDVYRGLNNREDQTVSLNLEEQPLSVSPDRVDGKYRGGSVC